MRHSLAAIFRSKGRSQKFAAVVGDYNYFGAVMLLDVRARGRVLCEHLWVSANHLGELDVEKFPPGSRIEFWAEVSRYRNEFGQNYSVENPREIRRLGNV
jgi:hypothetical protein